jgi:LAO/AO transport system kinase
MKKEDRHQKAIQKIQAVRLKNLQANELANDLIGGSLSTLAQCITLTESSVPSDRKKAQDILQLVQPHAGKSIRIGISGVPGAGKSTFIEAFGVWLCEQGHKVAVLAVDPSSETGKGSILGDKTRMNELAARPDAFIRPSPSSGNLGGVARKTRESIYLCEASGFEIILIETVGVGQNETTVHGMVDVFVLISVAGTGDELQGIKRGITELADIVLVNKADGNNLPMAKAARQDMVRAFHLMPEKESGWIPQAQLCSALEKTGLSVVWEQIMRYKEHTVSNGYFESHRLDQLNNWLSDYLRDELWDRFLHHQEVQKQFETISKQVISLKLPVATAAEQLLKLYNKD